MVSFRPKKMLFGGGGKPKYIFGGGGGLSIQIHTLEKSLSRLSGGRVARKLSLRSWD